MSDKKAIVVSFNGKSNAGGLERVVYYIDEYFKRRGIETQILDEVYLLGTPLGRLVCFLFRFRHFKKRKSIYLARLASAHLWLHKKKRNIVISHGENAPFFPCDFVFIHGCYRSMELAQGHSPSKMSRISNLQRISCQNAKQIIAVAHQAKDDLIQHFDISPQKITVLNNCVDTDRFKPASSNKLTDEVRTVLFVGRLENRKGLDTVFKLAEIIENAIGWKLLIACNTAENTRMFEVFSKTEIKIGLTIDNILSEAYRKADIMFLPSLFEGFEMVTPEALAAGVPVVGNKVGAIRELSDEKFPGVFLLEVFDNHQVLATFENMIIGFKITCQAIDFYSMVKERLGVDNYMQRLDAILGPAFFRKT